MKRIGIAVLAAAMACGAASGGQDKSAGGSQKSEPWLKNRIARSPYAPINRPPHNRDELDGEEDYYPQELLSAYARDEQADPLDVAAAAGLISAMEQQQAGGGRRGSRPG